uniref:Uncharacterized protein n=1 Tax=Magnetospirillum gryphiswaldense TaxID=55518 RepID=A4U3X7_9PROT|nr:hypothetical protein MGR_2195 [Magnetospirillum gryphiswaldense MSR-1]
MLERLSTAIAIFTTDTRLAFFTPPFRGCGGWSATGWKTSRPTAR